MTADDHGKLNLFNYPCIAKYAPHRTFFGHSSHVMGVKFLSNNNNNNNNNMENYHQINKSYNSYENKSDNDRVVSVGGNDCSVMMYTISKISK